MRRIEVIVYRGDDTDVTVLADGVPLAQDGSTLAVIVVDPGKGYMREDWDEQRRHYAQADTTYSTTAKYVIDQAYARGAETEFVEG